MIKEVGDRREKLEIDAKGYSLGKEIGPWDFGGLLHKSPIVQWFAEDSLRKLLQRLILRRRVSREGEDSVEESFFLKSDFSGRVEESLFCNKDGGKSTSLIFLLYALLVEEGERTGSHIENGKLFGSHLVNILP